MTTGKIIMVILFTVILITLLGAGFLMGIGFLTGQNVIRELEEYRKIENEDTEKLNNMLCTQRELIEYIACAESYAREYEIVKEHTEEFLTFLNKNEDMLTAMKISVAKEKKWIKDNDATQKNNIKIMQDYIGKSQEEQQANQELVNNVLKFLASLLI